MIPRLPGDARPLQGPDRPLVRLPPVAKGDPLTGGGPTVDKLCRELALVTDPTQTGRQLRRLPIHAATHRMDDVPRASLRDCG
jgi:hypothetical protein